MKALITLLLLTSAVQSQSFRLNEKEYFTISASIDPGASIKERGLDIVGEIELVSVVYAKLGFESFSALKGGYTDLHYGIGLNFTSGYFETLRYYIGGRQGVVMRNGGSNLNFGLEAGVDYNLNDDWAIGLRSTLDKRNDQKIFGWKAETKLSGFVRFCYKFDCR
jgi:hypothetical protein